VDLDGRKDPKIYNTPVTPGQWKACIKAWKKLRSFAKRTRKRIEDASERQPDRTDLTPDTATRLILQSNYYDEFIDKCGIVALGLTY
jgi:hypothetical protein